MFICLYCADVHLILHTRGGAVCPREGSPGDPPSMASPLLIPLVSPYWCSACWSQVQDCRPLLIPPWVSAVSCCTRCPWLSSALCASALSAVPLLSAAHCNFLLLSPSLKASTKVRYCGCTLIIILLGDQLVLVEGVDVACLMHTPDWSIHDYFLVFKMPLPLMQYCRLDAHTTGAHRCASFNFKIRPPCATLLVGVSRFAT